MTTTTATKSVTIRTRAYSNPVGQRRVRATSMGHQTSYAWDHSLDGLDNHREAARAHAIERHGMTSGTRSEEGQLRGKGWSWIVTDYAFDDDERHPDECEHESTGLVPSGGVYHQTCLTCATQLD